MANAADPHLLFGLLALQTGLIDQAQLLAAFHAWARDKSRPLADHLMARGDLNEAQRAAVLALAALHVEKHGGDTEKSLAALHAGPTARESLAQIGDPQINATLAHLGVAPSDHEADRTATYSAGAATSDGQRFRVLRPHARGGLGAVFVALDEELHREVALKQILDRHADDPTSRQRFFLEAEITGGLEHPGIVPVYGLGTYDNGRPYYAMRFIRGESLKESIAHFHGDQAIQKDAGRRSLALRGLLRRFTDVCNAIGYAHARGILHRDIKPGNVIIGKHGETLVVDWGLAKAIGAAEPGMPTDERPLTPSPASGSVATLPGSALGTPGYMSPEQARGELDQLGPQSDVYSLGASLYCLLTGRPPFEGEDIGAVLRQVQRGEFPPPRHLDRSIDPALEAICLKAMALGPAGRYASCRALGEDIERWMADEAVTAYREPFRRRLSRWERRNRALVHGGVAVLAFTAVGLAVLGAIISQEKKATEEAMKKAEASATEAQLSMYRAINAVYRFNSEMADQQFNRIPGLEPLRRRLTDEAVRQFKGFVQSRPDDATLILQADRVYRNAAVVHWAMGDFKDAKEAYSDAISLMDKLSSLPQVDEHTGRIRLASANRDMGTFLLENGHDREAAPYFAKAQSVIDRLFVEFADLSPSDQRELNRCAGWLEVKVGLAALEHGELEQAGRSFRRAIELLSPLIQDPKEWYWYRLFLSNAHRGLGKIARERKDEPADREFAEAERIARGVLKDAAEPEPRQMLANALVDRWDGTAIEPHGASQADAGLDEAVALLDRITSDFPAITWYRQDRASALLARGGRHIAAGRDASAERDLIEAQRLLTELIAKEPENWSYPGELGRAQIALGQLRLRQVRTEEARKLFDDGARNLERACESRPAHIRDRRSLDNARRVQAG
jgi:eukaryotic-like serine/threonine-protein kinase